MNDLNSFFDNATPAQINQLNTPAQAPQQEAPAPQPQQQHPNIQAGMGSLNDLPAVEFTEAAPDVAAEPEVQVQPQASAPIQNSPKESEETPQQLRFREIREAKLRAEWERDEATRRLREYEEARNRPQVHAEPEEDFGIAPDALLEGKDIAKIVKQIEQRVERKAEKKYAQQQQVVMQNVTENRLKMEYPDIEHVVSDQNIQMLKQMYPELAQSVHSNPDFYTRAKAAYTLIKKLNIVPEAPQQPTYDYEADKRRAQLNSQKPRPVQTVAPRQSPLAAAGSYDSELTDSVKKQYWKEMQQAMKG